MAEFQVVRQKKEDILAVARAHGLVNVRVFGSVARGEDTPASDIDFLTESIGGGQTAGVESGCQVCFGVTRMHGTFTVLQVGIHLNRIPTSSREFCCLATGLAVNKRVGDESSLNL